MATLVSPARGALSAGRRELFSAPCSSLNRAACCFRPACSPLRRRRQQLDMVPPVAAAASSGGGGEEGGAASSQSSPDEQQARTAAVLAADTFLQDEICVGVGTGLAANCLLQEIAQRQGAGKLRGLKVVPASDVAASEAAFHGVPLTTLQPGQRLHFYFEVADELSADEEGSLAFIVGRRQQPSQPQLLRARELAAEATTCVVFADAGCVVPRLGGTLPVLVEEEGWEDSGEELDDIFLGDAELWRRSSEEGAGPRGGDNPYVSAEGHAIIDVKFYEGLKLFGEPADYIEIAAHIEGVAGVVAHGLMANVAAAAIVVGAEGAAPRLVWRGGSSSGDAAGAADS